MIQVPAGQGERADPVNGSQEALQWMSSGDAGLLEMHCDPFTSYVLEEKLGGLKAWEMAEGMNESMNQ